MLRAIAAAKIADCLRRDFLPECHMASTAIRDRRRMLRYRNLVVKQSVQMKNRISGLLMETGVTYNKQRLHKVGYFADLMETNAEIHDCIRPLLRLSSPQGRYLGARDAEGWSFHFSDCWRLTLRVLSTQFTLSLVPSHEGTFEQP